MRPQGSPRHGGTRPFGLHRTYASVRWDWAGWVPFSGRRPPKLRRHDWRCRDVDLGAFFGHLVEPGCGFKALADILRETSNLLYLDARRLL